MNSSPTGRGFTPRAEPEVPSLDASRFDIREAIGTGGMGTVYRAIQRSVGRPVAIKMLDPEHAANVTGLTRFVREANVVARLTHPNIVQLIDFGRDRDGNLLIVMELLEGESLRQVIRREGRLAPERAVYIAVQVLNALRVAHAAGVIHRDLKPENIFLHRVGDDDHVKVLDFGVAKLTQGDVADQHTTQGSLVGTLRYMAPEQVAGEAPDVRIDVYAVGMMLYELLADAMPYDTRDRFVLLRQIIAEEPTHLRERAPEVPPELAAVVMKAIAKRPDERFAHVDELRRALKPFLAADHARLQALADATAGRSTEPLAGGEIRSGIVRSEHGRSGVSVPSASFPGARGQPLTPGHPSAAGGAAGAAEPSSPSAPSGAPSATETARSVGPPVEPQPVAPQRRRWRWALALALLLLAVLVGGGALLGRGRSTPSPAVASSSPAPPAPTLPSAPAQPEAPRPATRMVTVVTTPPGAAVRDDAGQSICAATPCAVPVPLGQPRTIQLVREGQSLTAILDGAEPTARIDLSALEAPAPAPAPIAATPRPREPLTPRRPPPRRPTTGGGAAQPANHGGDLPMFLPR